MKTSITSEIINNVYALHKKGVDDGTISSVLTISLTSVKRICDLMTVAERGDVETLVNMYGEGNRLRIKEKVMQIWGIDPNVKAETAEEAATDEQPPAATNNDAPIAEALVLLRRQCELLEKLCAAWGV